MAVMMIVAGLSGCGEDAADRAPSSAASPTPQGASDRGSPAAPEAGGDEGAAALSEADRARIAAYEETDAAVRAVIDRFFGAVRAGDAPAMRECCEDYLAAKIADAEPQAMDYEIREVRLRTRRAEVAVWVRYPQVTDTHNQFIMSYRLDQYGRWRITEYAATPAW